MHPITTSDQIKSIDSVGISSFFKPYKHTKRTLSGDFYIGTKLSFDEFKQHMSISTWFNLNGYNMALSGCQTSDMVKIGFLGRVQGYTYREHLKEYIMEMDAWKATPFSFRLYFDSFSCNTKGKATYVLMIDVDRPNVEQSIEFFQKFYDGEHKFSPNQLSYIFFPLYKKTYTDAERHTIVYDNDHHTDNGSVVTLNGLQELNTLIRLHSGAKISIRHLLLAIPAQGTINGRLFNQIERQSNNDWYLCGFNTSDSARVTVRLAQLESIIKRLVLPEDYSKLFRTENHSIKLNGQAAPVKKGKLPSALPVPENTLQYTNTIMKKLATPNDKRQAIEIEPDSLPTTYGQPLPKTPPTPAPHPPTPLVSTPINEPQVHHRIAQLESNVLHQGSQLSALEQICKNLAHSTKNLENQIHQMNDNVIQKFASMTIAINQLSTSSNGRLHKSQKSGHPMETDN
jgi:hypothetical protein